MPTARKWGSHPHGARGSVHVEERTPLGVNEGWSDLWWPINKFPMDAADPRQTFTTPMLLIQSNGARNKLEFDDQPLATVVRELQRYTDQADRYTGRALARSPCHGRTQHSRHPAALHRLERSTHIRVEERGSRFVLEYRDDPQPNQHGLRGKTMRVAEAACLQMPHYLERQLTAPASAQFELHLFHVL